MYIELSYSPKFQLLKCILSQEICLQSSLKFGIGNRHFETNAQRPGRARPLSVTSCWSRDFVLASVFVYSRSWLIFNLTVLSQNVFLILGICESENEEVINRLESIFWCTCERCEIMPTQRECVCCREQPEPENKMDSRITFLSLYCIGRSKWKNNFLCKLL